MKISYDRSIDAAYIYITNRRMRGRVARTYACDPAEVQGQIHLDFDEKGILLGIEVLDASHLLPAEALGR